MDASEGEILLMKIQIKQTKWKKGSSLKCTNTRTRDRTTWYKTYRGLRMTEVRTQNRAWQRDTQKPEFK